MDQRLQLLADVIVELCVRELLAEKKPPMLASKEGGLGDLKRDDFTPNGASAPI